MANAELTTLSKLLETKNLGYLVERNVDESWFLGHGKEWDFIVSYNQEYGGIPSRQTVIEKFQDTKFPTPPEEEFRFVVDELVDQLIRFKLKVLASRILDEVDRTDPHKMLAEIHEQTSDLTVIYEENPDKDIIHDYSERLNKTSEQVAFYEEFRTPKYLRTGFDSIDQKAPFMDGNLITVLGDTGSLKSYWMQAMAMNMVQQKHILLVSLEMSSYEIGWRADAISGTQREIDISNRGLVFGNNVNLMEYQKMLQDRAKDTKYGLWVADTTMSLAGLGSAQVIAKFDHYVRKYGDDFGMMMVDYTSLLEDGGTDWDQLKKITRKFKIAAHNLGKPILQIAQAKRGPRNRRITRDDIGYAWGMIEDSDKVFAISRESNGYLNVLCDKNRLGEEEWSTMVQADPDKGRLIEVEGTTGRAASF